ncbi:hypothetical protein PR048_019580 [Dryococelus australis]|uniref:MADF domain-containing protein n=1 Tax=Dryococelus australis TaxID=614101 RepID=A0ABQ9H458_9NEOP|nr:hypothetical protein PR048_019580 [Dryococelus australis]
MTGRWSEEQSTKFVCLCRDNEVLWNCFGEDYKHRDTRNAAYESMAREMAIPNLTAKEVPKKIKNMRSTYCPEVTKMSKSKSSGAGALDVHTPTIKWFVEMEEIMKTSNTKDRETFSNLVCK